PHTRCGRNWSLDVCSSALSGSFTVACVFEADLSLINTTSLSLFIPQVGQGWVLYLNGLPLRNELQMGEGGRLRQMRSLRNVVIQIGRASCRERVGLTNVCV